MKILSTKRPKTCRRKKARSVTEREIFPRFTQGRCSLIGWAGDCRWVRLARWRALTRSRVVPHSRTPPTTRSPAHPNVVRRVAPRQTRPQNRLANEVDDGNEDSSQGKRPVHLPILSGSHSSAIGVLTRCRWAIKVSLTRSTTAQLRDNCHHHDAGRSGEWLPER